MTNIEIKPLSAEGLKLYREKSPSKFKDKFGNLDLDNLPENFDFDAHRRAIIANKPKPELIMGLGIETGKTDFKAETPKVTPEVKEVEIVEAIEEVKPEPVKKIIKAKKK